MLFSHIFTFKRSQKSRLLEALMLTQYVKSKAYIRILS